MLIRRWHDILKTRKSLTRQLIRVDRPYVDQIGRHILKSRYRFRDPQEGGWPRGWGRDLRLEQDYSVSGSGSRIFIY
jgi:hypothetical protein